MSRILQSDPQFSKPQFFDWHFSSKFSETHNGRNFQILSRKYYTISTFERSEILFNIKESVVYLLEMIFNKEIILFSIGVINSLFTFQAVLPNPNFCKGPEIGRFRHLTVISEF